MLRVIGAGFGRTGTSSLRTALEQLGFKKCYHGSEVILHLTHARAWGRAQRGKRVDWDKLFRGYQATVDWPAAAFYKQLSEFYPTAKVILTIRDAESWYASMMETVYPFFRAVTISRLLPSFVPNPLGLVEMLDSVIWQGTFHGRFEDKAYAIQVFRDHIARVQREIPKDRLLVYQVSEGWAPLCNFFNLPIPEQTPFPYSNVRAEWQQLMGKSTPRQTLVEFIRMRRRHAKERWQS